MTFGIDILAGSSNAVIAVFKRSLCFHLISTKVDFPKGITYLQPKN